MFELEEIIKKIRNYDKIIIYGAGLVSFAFVEYLLSPENDVKITYIAVSNTNGNPKHILGIPVVGAESIKDLKNDSIVIIATMENLHYSIEAWLKEQGFCNILKLTNLHYSLLRKRNREFSIDVFSEVSGFRQIYEKTNQVLQQKLYNLSQDIRYIKRQCTFEEEREVVAAYTPQISVIIPVYNVENYLTECLKSVVNQTIKNIEIICIDDGSTDGSLEILQQFSKQYSSVQVIQRENGGLSAARNMGLKAATGEYIYFLDSDDCIEPQALSEMYDMAHRENLDVLYIDGRAIYESKELEDKYPEYKSTYQRFKSYSDIVKGTELFCNMVEDGVYYVQASLQLIRRGFLEEKKLRFLEGILYEDNLFNFQCILQAESTAHNNSSYFIRRVRKNSIMTSEKTKVKNFYGYLITYVQMISFALSFDSDERTQCAMEAVIQAIYALTKKHYYNLPEEELKKLQIIKPIEKMVLEHLKI